ncbi:MAG: hypothetical protein ACK4WD_12800 [Flavobacteriales bacterium]|jgi:hypothetical protein
MSNPDREIAIQLMEASFDGNPAVHFSIGGGNNYLQKRKALAEFLTDYSILREGLFISENRKAVICYYRSDQRIPLIKEINIELKLLFKAVGILRLPKVLWRSFLIKKHQKTIGPHLHCWYLGAAPEGRDFSAANELKEMLYKVSDRLQLPVLAETTMTQNNRVYERMGFKTYATVVVSGMKTFCMIREPNKIN